MEQTWPERIREWCLREFNEKYADLVADGMIDVAAGNRVGNEFEQAALEVIFGA